LLPVRCAWTEARIERGLQTFVEVGNALMEIREHKLYRSFGTFEEYCQKRWGWTRQRAYQLVGAAQVANNLSNHVDDKMSNKFDKLPTNDGQVLPLIPLTPSAQQAAWQEAVETAPNGKVTGSHVAAVAEKYKETETDPDTGEILPGGSEARRSGAAYITLTEWNELGVREQELLLATF
jgi:hypothetical protein